MNFRPQHPTKLSTNSITNLNLNILNRVIMKIIFSSVTIILTSVDAFKKEMREQSVFQGKFES